jgi:transcription initiation factor IIE alpha subunit
MEYVMVPVPEEHVVDVMQHVARLVARASVVPWDDEAVADVFDEGDEAARSLLSLVARTTVAGKELSDEDAAQQLELNVREVRAIVRDVNDAAQRTKREPLLALREATVVLRNGRSVQRRIFAMVEPVARAIRAHERSSLDRQTGSPTEPDG